MLNNATALLSSEQYRLFTFSSLAADQLVTEFFSTQHLSVKRVVEIRKKEGTTQCLKCQVPPVSLLKTACTKMLALQMESQKDKDDFKIPSPLYLPQPDKQLVITVANL